MLITLELPERVRLGESVPFTIRITNDSTRVETLELTGRPPAFDFVIEDENGNEVWRRLRGDVVAMMLQVIVLEHNESVRLEYVWDQRGSDGAPVQPGVYVARGVLPSPEGERRTDSRELLIEQ